LLTFCELKGGSLSCSVEYAQSQLKPKKTGGVHVKHPPKVDPLVGTIENDEHYKQFLAEISAPVVTPSSELEPIPARGLTPLLAAIKQKDQKKFAERMSKKGRKKAPKKAAAVPSKATAASSASKRAKKQKRKKNNAAAAAAAAGENGKPQFGAVKILGAVQSPAPAIASSSSASTTHTTSPANNEPKRKRPRNKPKTKKTTAASSPAATSSSNAKKSAPPPKT
jgi:hypothetical protein